MVNVSRPKSFLDDIGDKVNQAGKAVEGWKNTADEKMRQAGKAVENAVPKPVGNAIKGGLEKIDEVRKAGHDSMDVGSRLSDKQKKVVSDNREDFMNAAQAATGLAGAAVHHSQNKAIAKAEKANGTGGSGSKGGSKDKAGFAKSVAEGFANQTGIGTGYGSGDTSTRTQTQISNPVAQSTAAQESQKGAEDVVSNQASKASSSTGSAPKTSQTVETANKTQGNANNPGNKSYDQMSEAERFRADNQKYFQSENNRWGSSF